jgi:hypothetical protein
MSNTNSGRQQSASSPNSHSRGDLLATVSDRQPSRLVLAALRQARRAAEPGEAADATLHMAATMAHEVLGSRQARQEDRLWRTLMDD